MKVSKRPHLPVLSPEEMALGKVRYVTTYKLAKILGVNPSTIYRATQEGKLYGYRTPGGHFRIEKKAALAYIRNRKFTRKTLTRLH